MWFALLISRALANSEFSLRKRRNFIWINQSHQISGIKNQGPGDGFIFHFMSPNLCILINEYGFLTRPEVQVGVEGEAGELRERFGFL